MPESHGSLQDCLLLPISILGQAAVGRPYFDCGLGVTHRLVEVVVLLLLGGVNSSSANEFR